MTCTVPGCLLHRDDEERRHDSQDINRALFCHRHGEFWRSIDGVVICGVCHPAACEELVEERL